jgi:HPt (histidine-containing phosphotransfer) domain-containing protein
MNLEGIRTIDYTDAMRRLDDDRELFYELAEMVLQEVLQYSRTLSEACRAQDAAKVSYVAHTLKGAASNTSAMRLVAIASELSVAARTGDFAQVASLAALLLTERDDMAREIQRLKEMK